MSVGVFLYKYKRHHMQRKILDIQILLTVPSFLISVLKSIISMSCFFRLMMVNTEYSISRGQVTLLFLTNENWRLSFGCILSTSQKPCLSYQTVSLESNNSYPDWCNWGNRSFCKKVFTWESVCFLNLPVDSKFAYEEVPALCSDPRWGILAISRSHQTWAELEMTGLLRTGDPYH